MKNNIYLFLIIVLVGFYSKAQVLTQGNAQPFISGSGVLIDGSTSYSNESGAGNNVGKGIIIPSVDLIDFEFDLSYADGFTFPTYFDGMIVYNRSTGSTLTTGNRSGTSIDVIPGFYYFSNPNGNLNGNVTSGIWTRIGIADTGWKVIDDSQDYAVSTLGSVCIGSMTPNASAVLDISSTSKGFLPPRMTSAQRNSISSPIAGLTIFNIETNCLQWFNGSLWYDACLGEQAMPAASGSTFTTHSNGNENFSENLDCTSKLISASHTVNSCSGTIYVGNNTYNVKLINGQCWMQSNLKEQPSSPCGEAINTGCNIWLNTNTGDIGSWGYYNTTPSNGTAGWDTIESVTGEGLLYQWSAAMNGSTTERAQGVCPSGWHIPSDCEWKYLEHGLGMSIMDQNQFGFRYSGGVSSKLLSSSFGGSNSSGFTAMLSGLRNTGGSFLARGSFGYWWSSSTHQGTGYAYSRYISSYNGVKRDVYIKSLGLSVRCLKD